MTESLIPSEPTPADPAAEIYRGPEPESPSPPPATEDGDGKVESKEGEGADAPVAYEPFDLPKGMEVDAAALGEAQALFAEARLSQPQAQKLVDLYAGKMNELIQRQVEVAERRQMAWVAEVKADPELGGARFEAARVSARKALTRFGTPELRRSLDELWVGNNPHLFRFFVRVGQSISEDSWAGARSQGARLSPAEILYPPGNNHD